MNPAELKTWRKSLGLKMRELADILGVSVLTLARYESDGPNGRKPAPYFDLAIKWIEHTKRRTGK